MRLSIVLAGHVDVSIGTIGINTDIQRLDRIADTKAPTFEDPQIESQYRGIRDFDVIASARNPSRPAEPGWTLTRSRHVPEIVIPVYNADAFALNCIDSVIRNTDVPHFVTIIDDHSSPELGEKLYQRTVGRPWIRYIRNHANLGYTLAINRAIRQSTADSIVLLNSDTEVPRGWITRLRDCLESDSRIGIVGPLSNAASWQSAPRVKDEGDQWAVNELPSQLSLDDLAERIGEVSERTRPRVPVLNGFCMMISRKVFDEVGAFDEERFPLGYGEENDLCIRASKAGFDLVVADDVYVFHHKSKSFGIANRTVLTKQANERLEQKHGRETLDALVSAIGNHAELDSVRTRIASIWANIAGDNS